MTQVVQSGVIMPKIVSESHGSHTLLTEPAKQKH